MQIGVMGVGYVGLVTAAGLAETGNFVIGYDIDQAKIARLRRGELPIYEPGLDRLVRRGQSQNLLHFTERLEELVAQVELIFLALPTPSGPDGQANLSYLWQAAETLAALIQTPKILITKSTVPVGTARKLQAFFDARLPGLVQVASNPEFLREGYAVEDFLKPDRVIIGTPDPTVAEKLRQLYLPYTRQGNPIYIMDWESAELTKYASNAFLALRVSFMNEIARLAEKVGANIDMIRLGMGADSRIGRRYLFAGIGFGGSCFPKDTRALAATAREYGLQLSLVEATITVNETQRAHFFKKVESYYRGQLSGRTFAVWGVAFKADTDDIREAPAIEVIQRLLAAGAHLRVFDPAALSNLQKEHPTWPLYYAKNPYDALEGADALLIFTEWGEFRQPNWQRMKDLLRHPVIFDGRNLYEPALLRQEGFDYLSIGRAPVYAYSSTLARS
jgi:UDPglucose 6-dehydrogenase